MQHQPPTPFSMLPLQIKHQRLLLTKNAVAIKRIKNLTSLEAALVCNQLSEQEGLTPYYLLPEEAEFIIMNVRRDVEEYVSGCFYENILESVNYLQHIQTRIQMNKHSYGYRLPALNEWKHFRKKYNAELSLVLPRIALVQESLFQSFYTANPLALSLPSFFIARNY